MSNLALPGNPRYQPKALEPYFGYDNLARYVGMVEHATMRVLGNIGVIPPDDFALLTHAVYEKLLAITTTEVDEMEKTTKHDIRAWVRLAQQVLPEPLRRWVHVPLTSYDPLDTGRSLQFILAHKNVVGPRIRQFITQLANKVNQYSNTVQIGRTHGQHALPITVGFWLATILRRVIVNAEHMDTFAAGLQGKISGAVGAYNAQVGLGIKERCGHQTFEELVLAQLQLKPAPISSQILSPEPLAYYLFSVLMTSASLAQFGRDCRNLMRTEIAEVGEPFEEGQVGSSTMAHKRNPINFEQTEGMFIKSKGEFSKVLDTLVSEHQRDLVGSCVARDYPIPVVNLVQQLSTLLRENAQKKSFLQRISIDGDSCQRNLRLQQDVILAEPMYLALQMAGYRGDAHDLVNHKAVPIAQRQGLPLVEAVAMLAGEDDDVREAFDAIPGETRVLLSNPQRYVGDSAAKAKEIVDMASAYIGKFA